MKTNFLKERGESPQDGEAIAKSRTHEILDNDSVGSLDILLDNILIEEDASCSLRLNNRIITFRVVTVSPRIAEELLRRNTGNRPKSPINIAKYVKAMLEDKWQFDGEPLNFDYLGNLINGQHRLESITKSNKTLPFLVITGLSPEVFKTMDIGRKRTGSDVLGIKGIPSATNSAAATKFIYGFRNGKYSANRNSNRTLDNFDLLDYYYSLPNIQDSIKLSNKLAKKGDKLIPPATLAGLHYLFSEKDSELATEFITNVSSGVNLTEKSPMKALRDKLLRSKIDKNKRLTHTELISYMIIAWNAVRANKKLSKIVLTDSFDMKIN